MTVVAVKKAEAVTIGVGLMNYYGWYNPSYISSYEDQQIPPFLTSGPVMLFSFSERFSISAYVLLALADDKIEYNQSINGSNGYGVVRTRGRYDGGEMSLSFAYLLNHNLRIFLGLKAGGIDFVMERSTVNSGSYVLSQKASTHERDISQGILGIGFGASTPISMTERMRLTPTLSLLCFTGETVIDKLKETTPGVIEFEEIRGETTYVGINAALEVSYYFESISTSISIGGRYQYMKIISNGIDIKLEDDYNYGIIISAMYLF